MDLVVTPELALMGYLPRDLLMSDGFVQRSCRMLSCLASELKDAPAVLVGAATPNPAEIGRPLFNSAILLREGATGPVFHKTLLPTYDVFDEDRYFEPGRAPGILDLNSFRLGISICEDVWNDRDFWKRRRYHQDPVEALAQAGAQAIVNLSASPFTVGKEQLRETMLGQMARKHGLPLVWVNQVGGNDDLIFDGRSGAFDRAGRSVRAGQGFSEDLLVVDLARRNRQHRRRRFRAGSGDLERTGAGRAGLRAQDAFPESAAGAFRRHRLCTDSGHCGRRAGSGERAGRPDAVASIRAKAAWTTPWSWRAIWASRMVSLPIAPIMETYEKTLAGAFQSLPPT